MFTELYLQTTNPKLHFTQLFQPKIFFPMTVSVVFHTIVYAVFADLISYIFLNRFLSYQVNVKLIVFLVLIMYLGFIARFYHVKDVYNAYHKNLNETRKHLDNLYISWIFIS